MKTNQLILAAALVALAACNKESYDLTGPNTLNDEIGFTAVTKKATKADNAIVTETTLPTANTFKVWGWQSQEGDFSDVTDGLVSNFMPGVVISYTTGRDTNKDAAWRNESKYYYWPFTGAISFLAVHPSGITTGTPAWDTTTGKPEVAIANYTIAAANKTTDLMFATNASARRTDALPMVFKHALSQIEVKVKTNEDYSADVTFDVESVTFKNIDLSGDVLYSNNTIAWTENDTQDQNWTYYDTVLENINDSYQVYGAAQVMIPQPANIKADELDPGDANYDADDHVQTIITIGYSMTQTGSTKITGTVDVALPMLWEAGKKYNYTINFRLNEILFDPTVENWVGVDVTTINIY